MTRILTFIGALLILVSPSCKSKKDITSNEPAMNYAMPELIVDAEGFDFSTSALFNIEKAWIEQDTLVAVVNYSGGCEEHEFTIHTNGMFMKSVPPQITLGINHNNKGDNCRELVTKTLKFNIQNARYFGDKYGEVTVHLAGWPNPIKYTYPEGRD